MSLVLQVELRVEGEEVVVELVLLEACPPESSFNFSEVPDSTCSGDKTYILPEISKQVVRVLASPTHLVAKPHHLTPTATSCSSPSSVDVLKVM